MTAPHHLQTTKSSRRNLPRSTGCAARSGDQCNFVSMGDFPDISGKVGAVEIARCSFCGHAITLPLLPDVAFLYNDRESQDFQPSAKGISALIKRAAFRAQARKLLRQLPDSPSSVLDFGCGSGQFTCVLAELLPRSIVVGSDFHASAPSGLKNGHYRSIQQLNADEQRYDVVIAMHVLEHDDDTGALLNRISRLARRGGVVVIEVPNVDCVWATIFGKKWDAWYAPYHRTHFTHVSLRHRLELEGLQVISIHDITVPTIGRSLANCFGAKNNLFWLLIGIALHPIQWIGEQLTRRASAIRVIARI